MRISAKVLLIVLLCLTLTLGALARPQSYSGAVSNRLEDATQVITTIVVTQTQGAHHVERRFLKSSSTAKSPKSSKSKSKSKSSKRLKTKSKGIHSLPKGAAIGVFIGASAVIATVFLCFAFILVTEKRNTDPRWHMRYLLCGRKLKKRYSKAFSKKKCASDEETVDVKERGIEVSDVKVEVASSK